MVPPLGYRAPRERDADRAVRLLAGELPRIVGTVGAMDFARTSEEMARQAEPVQRGVKPAAGAQPTPIPRGAEGNNASVEVKPGPQQLDFPLKRPSLDW